MGRGRGASLLSAWCQRAPLTFSGLVLPPPSSCRADAKRSRRRFVRPLSAFFILPPSPTRHYFPHHHPPSHSALALCLTLGLANWLNVCKLVRSFSTVSLPLAVIFPLTSFAPLPSAYSPLKVGCWRESPCDFFFFYLSLLAKDYRPVSAEQQQPVPYISLSVVSPPRRHEAKLD